MLQNMQNVRNSALLRPEAGNVRRSRRITPILEAGGGPGAPFAHLAPNGAHSAQSQLVSPISRRWGQTAPTPPAPAQTPPSRLRFQVSAQTSAQMSDLGPDLRSRLRPEVDLSQKTSHFLRSGRSQNGDFQLGFTTVRHSRFSVLALPYMPGSL